MLSNIGAPVRVLREGGLLPRKLEYVDKLPLLPATVGMEKLVPLN